MTFRLEEFSNESSFDVDNYPVYGMLSGWSTAGKFCCPYCMNKSKAFRLKHSRKQCFFDCHRQFLSLDHHFMKNKSSFRKNQTEDSISLLRTSGEESWTQVKD